jgi:2,5-dihydroxypyridine 5,6-dioxygenase
MVFREYIMTDGSLVELFAAELKLCEVGTGQSVAVLSEGNLLREYAEASMSAASELGAEIIDVNLPVSRPASVGERIADLGRSSLAQFPDSLRRCSEADMVIDHTLLLFSEEQQIIQKAGARVLMVVEPEEVLKRLLPSAELRKCVEAAEKALAAAKELRFTNEVGTDITYNLGERTILTEYGYTTQSGRWDHWPSGFLATVAATGGVNGRVVMDCDDIIYPLMKHVESPIEFVVEEGSVVEINGASDARLLLDFIEGHQDKRAYSVSHIGWGLNKRCFWSTDFPGIGMDGRAYYGNVLFSLGPDTEFGGQNNTRCHLDLPMRNCSLFLDDQIIVDNGEIVPREMCMS